ncbi:MAG: hypothetical protein QXQ53_05980 [Candidatus Methanosuratincola sp.]
MTHYGQEFEQIAQLYDHTGGSYVWAHNLVNLHYSDDQTGYPLLLRLWKPADVERLEQGLRAAGIPLRADKGSGRRPIPASGGVLCWAFGNGVRKTIRSCERSTRANCSLPKTCSSNEWNAIRKGNSG